MADTTIVEQLQRLAAAKNSLKQSITAKQPNDATFSAARLDEYSAEVDKIIPTKSLTSATVAADDILAGKVAYGNDGVPITGTIETISVSPTEIAAKDTTIAVGKGYNPEAKTIQIKTEEQAKIVANNIRKGVSILGVEGTFTKVDANQITPGYVFHGLVGFVNGEMVTGTMPEYKGATKLMWVNTKLINDTIIVDKNEVFPSNNTTYLYTNDVKGSTEYKVGLEELKIKLINTNYQQNYQLKSFVGNSYIAESELYKFPKIYNNENFFTQESKNTIKWNAPFVNFNYQLFYEVDNGIYKVTDIKDVEHGTQLELYYDYNQSSGNKSSSTFHYDYGFTISNSDIDRDLYFTVPANRTLTIFGIPFPIKKGKIKIDTIIGQVFLSYQLPCTIQYAATSQDDWQPVSENIYSNSLSWNELPSSIQSSNNHTIKVTPIGLDYISNGFITTINKGV